MFSGFVLDEMRSAISEEALADYVEIGRNHLVEQRKEYDETLNRYMSQGTISVQRIMADWFPEIEVDVFISHSRDDKVYAEAFAGWLWDTFRLRSFIDSNVWNHMDILINLVNNRLCVEDFDENELLSHVHMMLAIALMKMIDKTEAIFLVNAGHAMPRKNETYSPWIFTEITGANLIRKKPLIAYREYGTRGLHENQDKMLSILEYATFSYELNLNGLEKISPSKMCEWENRYKNNRRKYSKYPLDALYEITRYRDHLYSAKEFAVVNGNDVEKISDRWNISGIVNPDMKEVASVLESTEIMEDARKYLGECRDSGRCPYCKRKKY